MNTALAEAAQERVDEVLPVQHQLGELLGLPEDRPALQQLRARREADARKGGRPPGARNKRLAELAAAVREHFGDVLLQQVAVATMPLADLMALGLKAEQALAEKRLSAATVLPYIEQRQPLKVDLSGRPPVYLTIELGAAQGQQDQGLMGAALVQLDGAQLDGAANPLFPQGSRPIAQLIADQAGEAVQVAAAEAVAEPAAPAAPAAPAGPPGGAVSTPPPLSRAPAGVVPPRSRILPPTRTQVQPQPGAGGGA